MSHCGKKGCDTCATSTLTRSAVYTAYQAAEQAVLADTCASELLSDLEQLSSTDPLDISALVTLEQDIERCEVLQAFFQAKRALWEEYKTKIETHTCCH